MIQKTKTILCFKTGIYSGHTTLTQTTPVLVSQTFNWLLVHADTARPPGVVCRETIWTKNNPRSKITGPYF